MKYEVWARPIEEGDIERLNPKAIFSPGEIESAKNIEKWSANAAAAYGKLAARAFGIKKDGQWIKVLGVCGMIKQWDGFGTCWTIIDRDADKYPLSLTKAVLGLLLEFQEKMELRRISFNVRSDYTEGHRFAKTLGFSMEGRMYGYLPDGADADLYARLF